MSMILLAADAPCEGTFVGSVEWPSGNGNQIAERDSCQDGLNQGWALERLGHAVAYLMDSRMFELEAREVRDAQAAVQILMRMRRVIFSGDLGEVGAAAEGLAC